jgi:SAM-dependent methyltransferase
MRPAEDLKLLDIGAEAGLNGEENQQLIGAYRWRKNVVAGNISEEHVASLKKRYPEIEAVVADACDLPWPDKHFDIVYSNAVIEHVGDFERQKKMAAEIMRVGKRWFVTTPNRWYPFEFHMRLPFVTWLPFDGYLRVGRIVWYNHVKGRYTRGGRRDDLRLMTARELRACFPGSKIIKQRVTFMAETLIVVGGDMECVEGIRS